MARRDYYTVLGLKKNASPDELRKAFRALALKYHPDRNPGDAEADRRFREVAEAWEVLGDAESRARYDRLGPLYTQSGRPPSTEDLAQALRESLGSLFRRQGERNPPEDLRFNLSISLELAAAGGEQRVVVLRRVRCTTCAGVGDDPADRQPCTTCAGTGRSPARRLLRTDCGDCQGRGYIAARACRPCDGTGRSSVEDSLKVRIPSGVATGQKLKVKAKGHEGQSGVGDLYVIVEVEEHPLFRRRGTDLLCEVPVTFAEATLGADIPVPTLDGTTTIRIPAGTASGQTFRLPSRGLGTVKGAGRGDLHVKISVEVPTGLDAADREAVRALSERLSASAHPRRTAWQEALRSRPPHPGGRS